MSKIVTVIIALIATYILWLFTEESYRETMKHIIAAVLLSVLACLAGCATPAKPDQYYIPYNPAVYRVASVDCSSVQITYTYVF